jgi:P27 family predicted phage terminase small subunit
MSAAAFVLGEYGKQEWARSGPQLHKLGLLTPIDVAVFAVFCQVLSPMACPEEALARQAKSGRKGAGLTVADGSALRGNPLLRVSRAAADLMLTCAREFGCTPLARSRIAAGAGVGQRHDDGKFDGLLA